MFARLARYDVPEGRIGEAVESFGEAGKELEGLDGFEGGYVLADEAEGSLMTITLWASLSAMEASSSRATMLRRRAADVVDGGVQSVLQYEVVAEQRATSEVSPG
jgi:heme-degrading monooxygenase HmoA